MERLSCGVCNSITGQSHTVHVPGAFIFMGTISPIFLISSLHNFPENWPGVISSERCEFSRETNLATYAAPRFANTDMPLKNLYVNIIV